MLHICCTSGNHSWNGKPLLSLIKLWNLINVHFNDIPYQPTILCQRNDIFSKNSEIPNFIWISHNVCRDMRCEKYSEWILFIRNCYSTSTWMEPFNTLIHWESPLRFLSSKSDVIFAVFVTDHGLSHKT